MTRFFSFILLLCLNPAESGNNDTGMKTATSLEDYRVDAYECDHEGNYLDNDKQKKKIGSVYSICMAPNQAAKNAGISIENIESWGWEYSSENDEIHFEPIVDGKPVFHGLSSFQCQKEGDSCIFNSFLTADFYKDAGTVVGSGKVLLSGGVGSVPVYLSLFLHKFKLKIDPELQRIMEDMHGLEESKNVIHDMENQFAQEHADGTGATIDDQVAEPTDCTKETGATDDHSMNEEL